MASSNKRKENDGGWEIRFSRQDSRDRKKVKEKQCTFSILTSDGLVS